MATDLTELVMHSGYDAFKNNHIKTGSKSISGTTSQGANIQTFTVTLDYIPDYYAIIFNGPTAWGVESDNRPAGGWSERIFVYVRGDGGGYSDHPCKFAISSYISGTTTLTIKASFGQTFTDALTLTATTFYYRVIDYSAY